MYDKKVMNGDDSDIIGLSGNNNTVELECKEGVNTTKN